MAVSRPTRTTGATTLGIWTAKRSTRPLRARAPAKRFARPSRAARSGRGVHRGREMAPVHLASSKLAMRADGSRRTTLQGPFAAVGTPLPRDCGPTRGRPFCCVVGRHGRRWGLAEPVQHTPRAGYAILHSCQATPLVDTTSGAAEPDLIITAGEEAARILRRAKPFNRRRWPRVSRGARRRRTAGPSPGMAPTVFSPGALKVHV